MEKFNGLVYPYDRLKVGDMVTVHTDEVLMDILPSYHYSEFWDADGFNDYSNLKGNTYKVRSLLENDGRDYSSFEVDLVEILDNAGEARTLSIYECYPTIPALRIGDIYG